MSSSASLAPPPAPLQTLVANGDFETYSEAGVLWDHAAQKWGSLQGHNNQKRGIRAVTADVYTAHPTFHPWSFAYDLHDGAGTRRLEFTEAHLGVVYRCPADLAAFIAFGGNVEAWNAGFDLHYVWSWCVRNWGWPELPLAQQRCSMSKAKAHSYPGKLDDSAMVLGTPRKDAIGGKLIDKLTRPINPTKKHRATRWTPADAAADFRAFFAYNSQDVVAEVAASRALPALPPFEFAVWQFDQRCNRRGMYINLKAVDDFIAILEQAQVRADAELQRLTLRAVWLLDSHGAQVPDPEHPGTFKIAYRPAVEAHTEVTAITQWCNWRYPALGLAELDEEILAETLGRDDLPADVRRVLLIRQELAFGSVKKLYALKAQTNAADSRIREQYDFSGAATTLWNGHGAQPANFPRPMHDSFEKIENVRVAMKAIATRSIEYLDYAYGPRSEWARDPRNARPEGLSPLEVVASCLRSLIQAPPGYRLISADFNAIQAVVTSCLADEAWRIEVFETHGKIYEAMASRLSGIPVDEIIAYKKLHGKHHPLRQNPGKLAVLSADFGAWVNGWKRFGADKLLGSDKAIKDMILKTNDAQPAIVELRGGQTRDVFKHTERPELYGMEGAIIAAVRSSMIYAGHMMPPRSMGPSVRLHDGFETPDNVPAAGRAFEVWTLTGKPTGVVYQMHGTTLWCRVPSGGFLRYHGAKLQRAGRTYSREWEYEVSYLGWNTNPKKGAKGWVTMSLYAGVAVQNVVAKCARDWQAECLLRLEDYVLPYPVVMHTHDENVCEALIGSAHTAVEHTAICAVPPAWAKLWDGRPWPVRVPDSWEADMYGKW